jgi:hypothetical protein
LHGVAELDPRLDALMLALRVLVAQAAVLVRVDVIVQLRERPDVRGHDALQHVLDDLDLGLRDCRRDLKLPHGRLLSWLG